MIVVETALVSAKPSPRIGAERDSFRFLGPFRGRAVAFLPREPRSCSAFRRISQRARFTAQASFGEELTCDDRSFDVVAREQGLEAMLGVGAE